MFVSFTAVITFSKKMGKTLASLDLINCTSANNYDCPKNKNIFLKFILYRIKAVIFVKIYVI